MQKISVYLNQRAANTNLRYWQELVLSSFSTSQLSFKTPDGLDVLKREILLDLKNGTHAIIGIGGDGTVNTLIQHLAYTKIPLLIIPGGTANDLARELGISHKMETISKCFIDKKIKKIDLIRVNNSLMATIGGVGIGGHVSRRINLARENSLFFKNGMKAIGKSVYSLFIVLELFSSRFKKYELEVDSSEYKKSILSSCIFINNQAKLAGTFNVAPETNNSDGKFNVTISTHTTRWALLKCITKVLSGNYPFDDPDLVTFETENIVITNNSVHDDLDFFGDGEILHSGETRVFNISIEKGSLDVFSPLFKLEE